MRLGGWSRLGLVVSALYGVIVAFVASDGRPRLEWLQSAWFGEAAEAIAAAITKGEGKEVRPYQVREALLKDGNNENAVWLEKVATSPSEKQKPFSLAVKQVNEKHSALIAKLPERQREYWLLAFAWWAGGTLLLFGTGWTVRWVVRGFRGNAVRSCQTFGSLKIGKRSKWSSLRSF